MNETADRQAITLAPDVVLGQKYILLQWLGQGGMGSVWKAKSIATDQVVCLKLLCKTTSDLPTLRRLARESKVLARLDHSNIVKILKFEYLKHGTNDLCAISTEFLEGQSLAQVLQDSGKLPTNRSLEIFRQVLAGLAHAHAHGIVHRDIKPSNIMISCQNARDAVKIVDFGIAMDAAAQAIDQKLTRTGSLLGSPSYMSPEQCSGQAVDNRTDIYSFGCLMYETLTGQVLFNGESPLEVFRQHLYAERDTGLINQVHDPELGAIISKCVQVLPQNRYQCATEVQAALDDFPTRGNGPSPFATRARKIRVRLRKRRVGRMALALATSIVLVPLALSVFYGYSLSQALADYASGGRRRLQADRQELSFGTQVIRFFPIGQLVRRLPSPIREHIGSALASGIALSALAEPDLNSEAATERIADASDMCEQSGISREPMLRAVQIAREMSLSRNLDRSAVDLTLLCNDCIRQKRTEIAAGLIHDTIVRIITGKDWANLPTLENMLTMEDVPTAVSALEKLSRSDSPAVKSWAYGRLGSIYWMAHQSDLAGNAYSNLAKILAENSTSTPQILCLPTTTYYAGWLIDQDRKSQADDLLERALRVQASLDSTHALPITTCLWAATAYLNVKSGDLGHAERYFKLALDNARLCTGSDRDHVIVAVEVCYADFLLGHLQRDRAAGLLKEIRSFWMSSPVDAFARWNTQATVATADLLQAADDNNQPAFKQNLDLLQQAISKIDRRQLFDRMMNINSLLEREHHRQYQLLLLQAAESMNLQTADGLAEIRRKKLELLKQPGQN